METKPIHSYIPVKPNTDVNTAPIQLKIYINSMLKEMVSEKESFSFPVLY